jgi:hypothetical protein
MCSANHPEFMADMSNEEVSLLSVGDRNLPSGRVRRILDKPVAVSVTSPGDGGEDREESSLQQHMFSRMLFCQMDILCHFPDGSKGWKETAR